MELRTFRIETLEQLMKPLPHCRIPFIILPDQKRQELKLGTYSEKATGDVLHACKFVFVKQATIDRYWTKFYARQKDGCEVVCAFAADAFGDDGIGGLTRILIDMPDSDPEKIKSLYKLFMGMKLPESKKILGGGLQPQSHFSLLAKNINCLKEKPYGERHTKIGFGNANISLRIYLYQELKIIIEGG